MRHFKKAILLAFVFCSFTVFADGVKDFHSFIRSYSTNGMELLGLLRSEREGTQRI